MVWPPAEKVQPYKADISLIVALYLLFDAKPIARGLLNFRTV